ncbi:MAG: hypothetical protein M1820_001115 [Bogoriella megaspora]|nr:MAG: hypothetical protein M1820_001115 [Bogoriella megaspora]
MADPPNKLKALISRWTEQAITNCELAKAATNYIYKNSNTPSAGNSELVQAVIESHILSVKLQQDIIRLLVQESDPSKTGNPNMLHVQLLRSQASAATNYDQAMEVNESFKQVLQLQSRYRADFASVPDGKLQDCSLHGDSAADRGSHGPSERGFRERECYGPARRDENVADWQSFQAHRWGNDSAYGEYEQRGLGASSSLHYPGPKRNYDERPYSKNPGSKRSRVDSQPYEASRDGSRYRSRVETNDPSGEYIPRLPRKPASPYPVDVNSGLKHVLKDRSNDRTPQQGPYSRQRSDTFGPPPPYEFEVHGASYANPDTVQHHKERNERGHQYCDSYRPSNQHPGSYGRQGTGGHGFDSKATYNCPSAYVYDSGIFQRATGPYQEEPYNRPSDDQENYLPSRPSTAYDDITAEVNARLREKEARRTEERQILGKRNQEPFSHHQEPQGQCYDTTPENNIQPSVEEDQRSAKRIKSKPPGDLGSHWNAENSHFRSSVLHGDHYSPLAAKSEQNEPDVHSRREGNDGGREKRGNTSLRRGNKRGGRRGRGRSGDKLGFSIRGRADHLIPSGPRADRNKENQSNGNYRRRSQ